MSRRVSFSGDVNDKPTIFFNKGAKGGGNKKRVIGIWGLRVSAVGFIERIESKVATAMSFVAIKKPSRKVSLARSRSYTEPLDSHRAQALEDCIQFLNSSSSSLHRSTSVSANSY